MSDTLNVGIGDTVNWHIMGSDKWVNTKIDRIHADPISQGLIMSPYKLEELGLNYTPTSIITSDHVNKHMISLKQPIHMRILKKIGTE